MDKFPLLWNGSEVGEMHVEQQALHTCFSVSCRLREEQLLCVWAVGEQGEFRLGILVPADGRLTLCRRFSGQLTAPVGKLLHGEVRAAGDGGAKQWQGIAHPEGLFQMPWLRRKLRGAEGVLFTKEQRGCCLAIPYDPLRPFPLTPLFCFARICRIRERWYAIYCFDGCERPVFHEKN